MYCEAMRRLYSGSSAATREVGGGWLGGGWLGHGSEARIVSEDRVCSASVSYKHAHRQVGIWKGDWT